MTQLFYQLKIAEEQTARAVYNGAGSALRLATIERRLAELENQYAPLSRLQKSDRHEAYAVAFFCVVGRWPEGFEYMAKEAP